MYINCANCDVYSMQMITANNDNNFLLLIEVSHDKSANCAAIDVSNMCLSLKLLANMKKKIECFELLIESIFNVNADES